MRALFALPLLWLAVALPAQGAQVLRHPLEPGQLWVHRGGLRQQSPGRSVDCHVEQLTCIVRPVTGEVFRIGGFVDVRESVPSDEPQAPTQAVFVGLLHATGGLVSFEVEALEGTMPDSWSPQVAFPPLPPGTPGDPGSPLSALLWWHALPFPDTFTVVPAGTERVAGVLCSVWHCNNREHRRLTDSLAIGHSRISICWDDAAAIPARVETYLLGAEPDRSLFQDTWRLQIFRVLGLPEPSRNAVLFERLTDPQASLPEALDAVAERLTDAPTARLVNQMAGALR